MKNFNNSFKLNGISFSSDKEVIAYSKNLTNATQQFLSDWFSSDEFIEVQTSGSTGMPKQIRLKKEFMKNSAIATGDFFKLPENTTALLCLSADYIAGKMMLVRALTLGWSLDVVEPTSEVKVTKKYDFSAMVPMQLRNSLAQIHNIKKLIVGGGVAANDIIEQIQDVSTEIFATYGMTETITHIAVKKLNNFSKTSHVLKTCEVYKTLPNVKIYIDERNCLVIKAEKIANEFIITNDVVQLISDTQFEWLGRYDNVINSGGVKLHPEKIEEKLSKVISNRFFVAGIKDAFLGEKLILVIENAKNLVRSERFQKPVRSEIMCEISRLKTLSKYEHPKEIYFIDSFVTTETNKIQRNKTLSLICEIYKSS